jgi:gliding motility-associated lipoprotein GldD
MPKIRGYSRVVLPAHQYQTFNDASFPFSFEYPSYGNTIKDTILPGLKPDNPYWMNIEFPQWGAKVYLTYKPIRNNPQTLYAYLKDTYTMSDAHEKKAAYIKEPEFNTPNKVHGVLFDVGGNTASALQFYATDSTQHFIRGALYFDVSPNADSLAPINAFLRADVEYMIKSLKWKP